jgi:drug/metabolite transporter (DMT)-like permease
MACAVISLFLESRPFYRIAGYSSATWCAIAVLGFLSWGIAMILWMWVLKRLDVGQISTSIYLLPIFGLILSVLAAHDRIRLPQLLGGVITLSGTVTLTFFDRAAAATRNL